MLKWLTRSVLAVLVLVVGVVALQIIASESGEVVVLHVRDANGGIHETRLWIADLGSAQYLRSGGDRAGWFGRLSAAPDVEVERAGVIAPYRAVPDPDQREALNRVMRAKYGWRETIIGFLVGGREGAVPIRLDPR
jgi:hypothetical protein